MSTLPVKGVVDQSTLQKIAEMMPKQKVEETEPKNVLTKMMIEGRADKLLSILTTIMNTYIEKDSYGSDSGSKTKNLVMTFMLEEKPKIS